MNATKLFTIAVAGVILVGGIAAVGAATPTDTPNANNTHANDTIPEHVGDEPTVNETEEHGGHADAPSANTASADRPGSVGPSDGLPGQVPEHVHAIHDRIKSFLNSSIEALGASLSELLSDGNAAAENGTASP